MHEIQLIPAREAQPYKMLSIFIKKYFANLRVLFKSSNFSDVVMLEKTWLNASVYDSEVAMVGYMH